MEITEEDVDEGEIDKLAKGLSQHVVQVTSAALPPNACCCMLRLCLQLGQACHHHTTQARLKGAKLHRVWFCILPMLHWLRPDTPYSWSPDGEVCSSGYSYSALLA